MSLSSAIDTLGSQFGPRFNLVGLFPSIVFFLSIITLFFLWTDNPSPIPDIQVLFSKISNLDLKDGILLVVGAIFFSILLQPLQIHIVKILEGYWGNNRISNFFSGICESIQRAHRGDLEKKLFEGFRGDQTSSEQNLRKTGILDAHNLDQQFPAKDRVLPTSLGNILRASEDIAGQRYGLETVILWPRLYSLISPDLRGILDDQRNQLDVAARFCAVFLMLTIITTIFYFDIMYNASINSFPVNFLLSNPQVVNIPIMTLYLWASIFGNYILWLTIPLATLLLSWVSYRGAASSALAYGDSIQTAFDLHRFDLLKTLHLPLPNDTYEEKMGNIQLSNFLMAHRLFSNENFDYIHDDDSGANASKPSGEI